MPVDHLAGLPKGEHLPRGMGEDPQGRMSHLCGPPSPLSPHYYPQHIGRFCRDAIPPTVRHLQQFPAAHTPNTQSFQCAMASIKQFQDIKLRLPHAKGQEPWDMPRNRAFPVHRKMDGFWGQPDWIKSILELYNFSEPMAPGQYTKGGQQL